MSEADTGIVNEQTWHSSSRTKPRQVEDAGTVILGSSVSSSSDIDVKRQQVRKFKEDRNTNHRFLDMRSPFDMIHQNYLAAEFLNIGRCSVGLEGED